MVPCGQAPHTHALRKQAEWSECRTFILPGSTPQRQRVLLTLDIAMAGRLCRPGPWCCISHHPLLVGSHALSQGSPRSTPAHDCSSREFSNYSSWSLFQASQGISELWLRRVSKWPNQATGKAAWPAPGSSCREQVQGRVVLALGREAT